MIGRIPEEHEVGEQLVELAGRRVEALFSLKAIEPLDDSKLREIRLGLVAPEPGVPQRRRDVAVATEDRDAERTAVHRVKPLEHAKHPMRRPPEPRIARNAMSGGVSATARDRSLIVPMAIRSSVAVTVSDALDTVAEAPRIPQDRIPDRSYAGPNGKQDRTRGST